MFKKIYENFLNGSHVTEDNRRLEGSLKRDEVYGEFKHVGEWRNSNLVKIFMKHKVGEIETMSGEFFDVSDKKLYYIEYKNVYDSFVYHYNKGSYYEDCFYKREIISKKLSNRSVGGLFSGHFTDESLDDIYATPNEVTINQLFDTISIAENRKNELLNERYRLLEEIYWGGYYIPYIQP